MVLILIEVERVNFLLLKRSFIMRIAQEMLVSTILSTRERECVCLEGSSYYGRVELSIMIMNNQELKVFLRDYEIVKNKKYLTAYDVLYGTDNGTRVCMETSL